MKQNPDLKQKQAKIEEQDEGLSFADVKMEINETELADILKKVDKESTFRHLEGASYQLVFWLAVAFSSFHLYTAMFGTFAAQIQRSVHLAFAFALVFLLYPGRSSGSNKLGIIDYCTVILAAFVGLYFTINYERLMLSAGDYTTIDLCFGALGILFTLEAARRVVGTPIVIIACFFLVYAYFGSWFPGFMGHRGYSVERIIAHMYFTTEGIIGIPLGVSATFIFLFILFGAFLEKTGIGKLFIDIANAIAGRASGGPAKVAVITSALEGTVSGSSVANTVGSGSFTIPMMKKLGYRPEFAGAVEAAASTGGQIMPPIMGAAAFLMAEFLGMPYADIAKAAVIPACLYFTGILIEVHFEAKRAGLKGMKKSEIPTIISVLKERGHLFLPLLAIIYVLTEGYTPTFAALTGLGLSVAAGMVKKETRMGPWDIIKAMEAGARGALGVAIACATAGIIVGSVTLTGLGLKMGNGLIDMASTISFGFANVQLFLTLFFTMIASLILGMGAPTTANYVITSTIAAPSLILLGIDKLAAHMFVFYFGIIADITPPVALAAYAGAGIAKADPFKTGVEASKLAIGAFIVPYIFVYNPAMLLIGTTPWGIFMNLSSSLLGMVGVGAGVIGFMIADMSKAERVWAIVAGLLLIDPGALTDVIGLGMLVALSVLQYKKMKEQGRTLFG